MRVASQWGVRVNLNSCLRVARLRRAASRGAAIAVLGLLALPAARAQEAPATPAAAAPSRPAAPGDAPVDAGPPAGLSPRIARPDIARALKLVADWQLARLPAQPQYDWTFAALYTGMMAVPEPVAGDEYKQAMRGIGERLAWQPGPRVMMADDQAVGQMFLEQYVLHHDPAMLAPMQARMDAELSAPEDPTRLLWWWCDALFMAPPVLADLASLTGDSKYWDFLHHQWTITSNLLYDRRDHLFSRDSSFLFRHEKNGRKVYWSRGNGWVMAGIVRVLDRMPADSPLRAGYVEQLRLMAAAVAKVQGRDGLWRPGLLDPSAYPLPEVSGSAFITYALAYGVNHHLLPAATYAPRVRKAWAGLLTHVFADGRLGCIQPVGAAPGPLTPTSSYVYGVGAYLLAGSEIYRGAR